MEVVRPVRSKVSERGSARQVQSSRALSIADSPVAVEIVGSIKRMEGRLSHGQVVLRSLCQQVLVAVDRRTEPVSESDVFEGSRVHEAVSRVIAARSEESWVDVVSVVGKVRRSSRGGRELGKIAMLVLLLDLGRSLMHSQGSETNARIRLCEAFQAIPLLLRWLLGLCDSRVVGGAVSLLWLIAANGLAEPSETHSRSVTIRNGLHEDWILSDLFPVDVFEVLLVQDGQKEPSHGVLAVGGHDEVAEGMIREKRR